MFYELDPDAFDDELLPPPEGWAASRVPVQHVLNSVRSSEIIRYQLAHHDEGVSPNYDPEGYADEIAAARARRWRGE